MKYLVGGQRDIGGEAGRARKSTVTAATELQGHESSLNNLKGRVG